MTASAHLLWARCPARWRHCHLPPRPSPSAAAPAAAAAAAGSVACWGLLTWRADYRAADSGWKTVMRRQPAGVAASVGGVCWRLMLIWLEPACKQVC